MVIVLLCAFVDAVSAVFAAGIVAVPTQCHAGAVLSGVATHDVLSTSLPLAGAAVPALSITVAEASVPVLV